MLSSSPDAMFWIVRARCPFSLGLPTCCCLPYAVVPKFSGLSDAGSRAWWKGGPSQSYRILGRGPRNGHRPTSAPWEHNTHRGRSVRLVGLQYQPVIANRIATVHDLVAYYEWRLKTSTKDARVCVTLVVGGIHARAQDICRFYFTRLAIP